ncbi:MAG: cation diffusion facilitator family transporter [Pleurocapsa minor HA4230-MV1]|jgi:cation diffusion facilitator family transporter|nr:cation diffusion facilitator family transporter [Pleurocapsa minor HA4230-MV1]
MNLSHQKLDSQQSKRQSSIQKVLYITLGLNLLVLETKFSLGLATGSLSLLADALHSLSDSASNILGLIAMRLANPKPDWDHPYGHSKFESLGALGIAGFLIVAGIEILDSAVKRLFFAGDSESIEVSNLSLVMMITVLMINIGVAVYEAERGKALNSKLLQADARHTFSDVWVTVILLVGMWGIRLGFGWLDIVLAFLVAGLVFWSAWEVIRENVPFLSDRVAIPAREIMKTVTDVYGVLNCHSITSRGVLGQAIFIEMHLVVAPREISEAYKIVEAVEQKLQEKYGSVHATIQLEPHKNIELLESHLKQPQS